MRKDLERLVTEHDFHTFDNDSSARKWLESMPIENLNDLYCVENRLDLNKPTLRDIKNKSKIRKKYNIIKEEIERKISEYNIANIELLQKNIENILESSL